MGRHRSEATRTHCAEDCQSAEVAERLARLAKTLGSGLAVRDTADTAVRATDRLENSRFRTREGERVSRLIT